MIRVGVDVGGSGARAARVTDGEVGRIVARGHDRSVDDVVRAVAELAGCLHAEALAVGVPGRVEDGVVRWSVNLGWRDVPLAARIADATGRPVALTNDADAATWGAWLADRRDLVLFTLGTGVGGGIVADGRLVRGTGGAGELGHLYVGGDRPCACGGVGCLETWCSTVGLVRSAREHGRQVRNGREVVEAADAGAAWAVEAVAAAGRALGQALVSVVNVLAPARIVVVGGLAGARLLRPEAERVLAERAIVGNRDRVALTWGGRAEALAIRGAVALAPEPPMASTR